MHNPHGQLVQEPATYTVVLESSAPNWLLQLRAVVSCGAQARLLTRP